MLLEGIFPPITTPFYPDGRLYLRKLEYNVALYSRTQLAGMVILGSTGEAIMMSPEEQREVLRTAIAAASPEKVMIAGTGHESLRQSLAMAEEAASAGYDAVLVRTPHFYRKQMHRQQGPQLEMLNYYRMIADASPLPVLLYNVPVFTAYDLPLEVVTELAGHPNIIGIKDSNATPDGIEALVKATQFVRRTVSVTTTFAAVTRRMQTAAPEEALMPVEALQQGGGSEPAIAPLISTPATVTGKMRQKETGFAVLTGGSMTFHEALSRGASGGVLGFATCAPQCCYEIWTAWKEGDTALAQEKQQRISQAAAMVGGQMGVPGLKFACDLNGYYGGRPRLPLLPLTAAQQHEVTQLMADIRY